MNAIVISYSLTGNNDAVAAGIAAEFAAEHIRISESKPRTMVTIFLDILFNRTPQVNPVANKMKDHDLVIFMGPVWMGKVATPLRAYFRSIKDMPVRYAFIAISGGAEGANPGLAGELNNRTGKEPAALIDMHIAGLLPQDPKPTRKDTSAYRLTDTDIKSLTDKAVKALRETLSTAESVY